MNLIPNKITFLLKKIILGDLDNVVMNLAIFVGKSLIMRQTKLSVKLFIMNLKICIPNELEMHDTAMMWIAHV